MVTNRLAALLTWTSNRFTAEQFEECVKETHSPNIQSIRGSKSKGGGGGAKVSNFKYSNESLKLWEHHGVSGSTCYRNKLNKLC